MKDKSARAQAPEAGPVCNVVPVFVVGNAFWVQVSIVVVIRDACDVQDSFYVRPCLLFLEALNTELMARRSDGRLAHLTQLVGYGVRLLSASKVVKSWRTSQCPVL